MAATAARLRAWGAELAQLLGLFVSIQYVTPLLQQMAPELNPFLAAFIGILVMALLVELLLAVFVPPVLRITWRNVRDPNPLDRLNIEYRNLRRGTAKFELSVAAEVHSLTGWLILRHASRKQLTLRIEAPVAPIYLGVDFATPLREVGKSVTEMPGTYGVDVLLDMRPPKNTWVWAKVWLRNHEAVESVSNETFDLSYKTRASTWGGRMCANVIRRNASAHTITLHR